MAAALEAGVTRLFRVGGAHAIAALAYGTATIPRVDKIVGPGNRYVAAAKALVAARLRDRLLRRPDRDRRSSPAPAGRRGSRPTSSRRPSTIPTRAPIFITWSRPLAERVVDGRRARAAPAAPSSGESLAANGAVIVARHADEAMALANRFAPEHLVVDREALAKRPITAGAVFVGPYTAQAAGDYATGSNHVLPTAGAARFRGGLSAADFVRVMSVQRVTRAGLRAPGADDSCRSRAPKGSRRTRSRSRCRLSHDISMSHYQKPPELYDGLRLHQNENTGGCSPRVLEALARLRADRSGSIRRTPAPPTRSRRTSASRRIA